MQKDGGGVRTLRHIILHGVANINICRENIIQINKNKIKYVYRVCGFVVTEFAALFSRRNGVEFLLLVAVQTLCIRIIIYAPESQNLSGFFLIFFTRIQENKKRLDWTCGCRDTIWISSSKGTCRVVQIIRELSGWNI